jgi:hypothetical protein
MRQGQPPRGRPSTLLGHLTASKACILGHLLSAMLASNYLHAVPNGNNLFFQLILGLGHRRYLRSFPYRTLIQSRLLHADTICNMAGIGLNQKKFLPPAMTMCTPHISYAKLDLSCSLKSDVF